MDCDAGFGESFRSGGQAAATQQESAENIVLGVPLADGHRVEAVWYPSGTLCLSTQVGCGVGCPFCLSGANGLFRNLSQQEMESQVEIALNKGLVVRRLTLSGIGEPLHNAAVVEEFLARARARHQPVSLTTVGAPLARLQRVLEMPHNGVMISLHAGTPETHRRLVPHGPNLQKLWGLLLAIRPHLSGRQRRRIGINYLLLQGINDSDGEIVPLLRRLDSFPELTLHLLNWNRVARGDWESPPWERFVALRDRLLDRGLNVRLANRWRRNLQGGCGTLLASREMAGEVPLC